MGKYRKVDPRIWNDEKFRQFSDAGKLCFFFLLTHPHMTPLGAMRASIPGLAAEMGWKEKAFRGAFEEAFSKAMVKVDERACFLWIPNFLKYNGPESPNVVKAWVKCLDDLPECSLKNECLHRVKAFTEDLPEAFTKALPEAFAKTMANQEQEQEQEKEGAPTPTLCPHREIIDLYHEILPELARVRAWTKERQKALRARWKEDPKRQNSDWWKGFFEYVRKSPFLLGENDRRWTPNLNWLVTESHFVDIVEGKYHGNPG
ncbi:MAG: hypothetical protein ACOWYE_12280 [Desulfatiglandales bacterium]